MDTKRILVVECEEAVRQVLRELLEDQGCEVLDVASAEEGLLLLEKHTIHVALLEAVLPGMSGVQLLEKINDVSPLTQTIMMTSYASLETAFEVIEHGAYAYLQKPFEDLEQIWMTVSRALEKRQLTELLEQRNFELQKAGAAARAKSLFLSRMGHELRTPLNVIIGYGELLEDEAESLEPEELRADLHRITSAGRDLLDLINSILDYVKIEAGNLELDRNSFDLHQGVNLVSEIFAEKARQKKLRLDVAIDGDVPTSVQGDFVRLRQVLINVLDNAIKFTDSGEVFMRVSCEDRAEDSVLLCFQVTDTGIGIAPELCERIFEDFTQLDGTTERKYGGIGLGLALSKQLVALMGGTIKAQSQPGKGSVVELTARLGLETAKTGYAVPAGS
jgi:signal transduction histidine kinase